MCNEDRAVCRRVLYSFGSFLYSSVEAYFTDNLALSVLYNPPGAMAWHQTKNERLYLK